MKKKDYDSKEYFRKSGTTADTGRKTENHKSYQREIITEKRYNKKSPSIIRYKGKLKRINE